MLQPSLFENESGGRKLPSYQEVSLANRTALQESVKHLLTSVIFGQSSGESLAKLLPNGYWVKTYQGYLQASLDGSLEEFSEICPSWGILQHGVLTEQMRLEPFILENGLSLYPTPTANLGHSPYSIGTARKVEKGIKTRKSGAKIGSSLKWEPRLIPEYQHNGDHWINPDWCEQLQGFPQGWTKLETA